MEGQVKVGLRNWMVIGIMAILFILVAKVIFTKYPVPHVSEAVQAV